MGGLERSKYKRVNRDLGGLERSKYKRVNRERETWAVWSGANARELIDTSELPVNHCSQSTAFGALNRKAHGTHRDGKIALQAKQQHNVNSADALLLMTEKSKGLVIGVLVSALGMNTASRSITVQPVSQN